MLASPPSTLCELRRACLALPQTRAQKAGGGAREAAPPAAGEEGRERRGGQAGEAEGGAGLLQCAQGRVHGRRAGGAAGRYTPIGAPSPPPRGDGRGWE